MWCRNLESPRLEGTVDGIVLNALNYIVGFMNNRYAALSSQKKQFLSLALCFQWGFVVVKMALFSFYKMGTTIMFYPLEERFSRYDASSDTSFQRRQTSEMSQVSNLFRLQPSKRRKRSKSASFSQDKHAHFQYFQFTIELLLRLKKSYLYKMMITKILYRPQDCLITFHLTHSPTSSVSHPSIYTFFCTCMNTHPPL